MHNFSVISYYYVDTVVFKYAERPISSTPSVDVGLTRSCFTPTPTCRSVDSEATDGVSLTEQSQEAGRK